MNTAMRQQQLKTTNPIAAEWVIRINDKDIY